MGNGIRSALLGLLFTAALLSAPMLWAEAEYVGGSPQNCLMCHGERSVYPAHDILHTVHAVSGAPGSPFAEGGKHCEACHGPSKSHLSVQDGVRPLPAVVFDDRVAAEKRDGVCLDCHNADAGHHWLGSAHQFEEVTCTDCHQVHPRRDPALASDTRDGVCMDCHRAQRADFHRPSTHPLRGGMMHCTDCHKPHGSGGPAMLVQDTLNDTCYDCHAEKRGPFLWEHQPVAEDCTSCHLPHGSNHRNLLVTRSPMLCQQCHIAPFHPSTVSSGRGGPPAGADRQLLGSNCLSCHANVHGSNHPSGAGLTR
jgi:DmsE family decaheme c-type cytochrome